MRVFVSGGCKNGKSLHAQRIAKKIHSSASPLYYLATMIAKDEEDEYRILRHRQERNGWGFETVELSENILKTVYNCDPNGSFLLDSVTALLANEMFKDDGSIVMDAYKKVSDDIIGVLNIVNNIVIVSDFIYSDAFEYEMLTEAYRKGLAMIDRAAAKHCDVVLEACCGNLIIHKGKEMFKEIYYESV